MNDEALDLLAELRAVGLALSPEGDGLCVCPRSKLTEARRQAILTHKRELLAVLEAERTACEIIGRVALGARRLSEDASIRRLRTAPGGAFHPQPNPLRQAATPGQNIARNPSRPNTANGDLRRAS